MIHTIHTRPLASDPAPRCTSPAYVRMDSAKARVDARVHDAVTAACVARYPHITRVKHVPTKSPDANLLDLCFFRSLSRRTRKIAGQQGDDASVGILLFL